MDKWGVPEGHSGVETVAGGAEGDILHRAEKPISSEELNKTADQTIKENFPKSVSELPGTSRQAIHILGDPSNALDFHTQPSGPEALQELKGLSHEDMQRYLQSKGVDTTGYSFSRSGSAVSSIKQSAMQQLLDKVSPQEVLKDLKGGNGAPPAAKRF
jgi:hypothetical protein